MEEANQAGVIAKPDKYLTFNLALEEYGIEILKVQEIMGMLSITRVPRMPDFIRGIINLRGKLIPIVEMRKKFNLPVQDDTPKTCIIVVKVTHEHRPITMGIIVDHVSEVLDITDQQIEPPPTFGQGVDTGFMLGIGKVGKKIAILLDIDRILTHTESADLVQLIQSESTEKNQKPAA